MKLKMIFENEGSDQRDAVRPSSRDLASFPSGSGSATARICLSA